MYQDCLNIYIFPILLFKKKFQVEISDFLHESIVEGRHLLAGFENNRAGGSRFEREGRTKFRRKSAIFFANSQNVQKVHQRNPLRNGSI